MKTQPALRIASLVLSILAAGAPCLHAGIIPISQTRTVSISGRLQVLVGDPPELVTIDSFSDSRTATGFGLFDESLEDSLIEESGNARAEQISSISPTLVRAFGRTGGSAPGGPAQTNALSSFALEFEIVNTEVWRFSADFGASGESDGRFVLSHEGTPVIVSPVWIPDSTINQLVELIPGSWSLLIEARTLSIGPGAFGDSIYDVTFQTTIPEPTPALLLATSTIVLALARRILAG